jgi:hypothetical protein
MARLGSERGVVPRLNNHALRLVGLAFVVGSGSVTTASLTTGVGLAIEEAARANAVADLGTVDALVEFSLAHPAYPAVLSVGLVLLVLGDDAPLA